MPKIRLLKEPGYIYDLLFIFVLRFNKQFLLNELNTNGKQSENIEYFDDLLEQFSDIPEDLYLFFHTLEHGRCFLTTQYLYPYKEQFTTTFNFKFFQNELLDKERLIRNLIRFYFCELSEEKLIECINSETAIFLCIKNSNYSDTEKSRLYEFFLDPEPYLQTLQFELMAKELMLSQYYKKNYQKILDVNNQNPFETLSENVKKLRDLSFIKKNNQNLYVSYCLISKYVINFFGIQEGAVFLLGYDYLSVVDLAKSKKELSLLDFGNALGEASRVKILELLLEREEVTCKDLEKIFSFSGSTAYHHITMMMKIGLVKTREEGKTILYSLNGKYFDAVIGVLSKFSKKHKDLNNSAYRLVKI